MRRFRIWLSNLIAPKMDNHYLVTEAPVREDIYGIDFNIKKVANGTIITTTDWELTKSSNKMQGMLDPKAQYVIPEGGEILPHIISILASRKLQ